MNNERSRLLDVSTLSPVCLRIWDSVLSIASSASCKAMWSLRQCFRCRRLGLHVAVMSTGSLRLKQGGGSTFIARNFMVSIIL